MKKVYLSVLFIGIFVGMFIGSFIMDMSYKYFPDRYIKTDTICKTVVDTVYKKESITIVTPIIEYTKNGNNRPSYCKPEEYHITKINNGYYCLLPGMTVLDGPFNTIEEAQIRINKTADESYKRWLETDGLDF